MADRVSFSGLHLNLHEVFEHYNDVEAALRQYFSIASSNQERFAGYSQRELFEELEKRLAEENQAGALSILAALEAAFRIDYLQRVYAKKKDNLSRAFRKLHQEKGARISLEDEIFDAWQINSDVPSQLVSDLRGAFRYRHWLAHGRYWKPKLGQRYDYQGIYELAESILNSFPMYGYYD